MIPITPHLANECLEEIVSNKNYFWPEINNKYLENNQCKIVIQINGKKRGLVIVDRNISQDKIMKKIKSDNNLNKYLENKEIKKEIFIKNRLMNIII